MLKDKRHATQALHANRGESPLKHSVECNMCGTTFMCSHRRKAQGPHYCFQCRRIVFNQRSPYSSRNALGYGRSKLGALYTP